MISKTVDMDLSIIIPVYNVEKFVRTCIESIFQQDIDENRYEVIIVNDGTQDRSMETIADIILKHSNVMVVNQENQGLSVARNNGIIKARGEYLLMLDSDDLLCANSINPLLAIALETNADIVLADYKQMSNEEIERYVNNNEDAKIKTAPVQITTGEDFLYEQYCRNVWRYMYKRDFILRNNISFIPGIISQDVPFANECFLKAKKCAKVQLPLTIYRWGNPSQATSTFSVKKAKDLCIAIQSIWCFTKLTNLSPLSKKRQKNIVYAYFFRLISATTYGHIKKVSERLEIIDYMRELEPELYFHNNLKQIVWSWLYHNMPHTMIRVYGLFTKIKKKL